MSIFMSRQNRRNIRGNTKSEINIVPLMDVLLVLLIIFMLFATLIISGININIPNASSTSQPLSSKKNVTLTLDASGMVTLNGQDLGCMRLDKIKITQALEGYIRDNNYEQEAIQAQPIIISASKDIDYNSVMQLLDAAKAAGFKKFTLASKPTS
jgi:biopolymer transport protein TolR